MGCQLRLVSLQLSTADRRHFSASQSHRSQIESVPTVGSWQGLLHPCNRRQPGPNPPTRLSPHLQAATMTKALLATCVLLLAAAAAEAAT